MKQRIIKFKAKCIADGEWAKGYYFKKPSYKKTSNGDIVEDGEVYCIYGMTKDDVHQYWYEVDPSTVCQFTGLKDKDGKEIWEHDIIKLTHENGFVQKAAIEYFQNSFIGMDGGIHIQICLYGGCDKNILKRVENLGSKFDRKEEK